MIAGIYKKIITIIVDCLLTCGGNTTVLSSRHIMSYIAADRPSTGKIVNKKKGRAESDDINRITRNGGHSFGYPFVVNCPWHLSNLPA